MRSRISWGLPLTPADLPPLTSIFNSKTLRTADIHQKKVTMIAKMVADHSFPIADWKDNVDHSPITYSSMRSGVPRGLGLDKTGDSGFNLRRRQPAGSTH